MNWKHIFILVITVLSSRIFPDCLDPLWLFADSQCTNYHLFTYQDTCTRQDLLVVNPYGSKIETGDSYDGSTYINFNYQFQSDTFYVRDSYDTEVIRYKDFRPGFAGFIAMWDQGISTFNMARYKYLIFAHKGPSMKHKTTVKWWLRHFSGECEADGVTGATHTFRQQIGSFSSSEMWKLDTIVIPEYFQNLTDQCRNSWNYMGIEFDITNLNSGDTTSGLPGCLKIDNLRLSGRNPIESSPESKKVQEGESVSFRIKTFFPDSSNVSKYQWNKNGTPITGKNDSVFSLGSVKTSDAGKYSVTITVQPSNLTFTSNPATLSLNEQRGCGSGICLALLPPLYFKTVSGRKRKRNV